MSINVAALSNVTFELRYQELLRRRLGTYEHAVYVNPGQPVQDMMIEIFLTESQRITYFRVPPLRTENAATVIDNKGNFTLQNITNVIFLYINCVESLSMDKPFHVETSNLIYMHIGTEVIFQIRRNFFLSFMLCEFTFSSNNYCL